MIENNDIIFQVGQKITFAEEKRPYTVRACNDRYAICTKPFNLKNTVLYTIVDLKNNIRGTENLIFCMGFEDDEECKEALERLEKEESEISKRNYIGLNIVDILNLGEKRKKPKVQMLRCLKCKESTVKRELLLKGTGVLMTIHKCTNCQHLMTVEEMEEENYIRKYE